MAGRKPAQAVENFLAPIKETVLCVAEAYLNVSGGYHPSKNPNALILNDGQPIRLGKSDIRLLVQQQYNIVEAEGERGRYRVSTASYAYSLLDSAGEIVAYHWHPFPGWEIQFPHIHFRRDPVAAKAHFPTGRVAIEEVVYLAIREFGVTPRRQDYKQVLDEGLAKFRQWRTWG